VHRERWTRAGEVIRGLRALAKKSGPELAQIDINDAVREVQSRTRSELERHGITLHTDLSADDRPVFGNRVQLQQVLLNLIMNGVEAMRAVTERSKTLAITSEPVEPSGVLVAVEDTGTGVDPATADRIFDPFFTTKSDGLGMGSRSADQSSTPMAVASGIAGRAVRHGLPFHCAGRTIKVSLTVEPQEISRPHEILRAVPVRRSVAERLFFCAWALTWRRFTVLRGKPLDKPARRGAGGDRGPIDSLKRVVAT
jgi:hypothetical protein